MNININDPRYFKTWNFYLIANPLGMIIDAIAVLIGDYEIQRKQAANVILSVFLRDDFKQDLFENPELYPIDRNDTRVTTWKKQILSHGKCEKCGSKENLEAHHKLYWSVYPMGRCDVENGECLCIDCHAKAHSGEKAEMLILSKKKKVLRC